MAATLAYTRKFIILKKEFTTISGISPKGHGKLEVKGLRGILTANIENAEKDHQYNVSFISNDKTNPIWNLGKIFTDDLGRGKGEYVFIQRDLESKNFFMDKIVGILITKDENILLGGYIDKENGSIERYIQSMQRKKDIEPAYDIPAVEPTHDPSYDIPAVEPTHDPSYDIPAVEPIHDPSYDIPAVEPTHDPSYDIPLVEPTHDPIYDTPAIEPSYEPLYDLPETQPEPEILTDSPSEEVLEIITEEAINEKLMTNHMVTEEIIEETPIDDVIMEEIEDNITFEDEFDSEDFNEDSMEPDYKTLDHIRKLNQKNQTTNYVLSILRFFPYIDPFKYSLKGYNWWIVELDKENEYRSFLPYFSYISGGNTKEYYANDTTNCNQLMNKYQHYLFGLYNEEDKVKYFIYGVPGSFTKEEHPYKGANGFNIWYPGQNIEGYWLLFIDPMTGKPVDTPVPMVPVD